ncbi:MAG: YifB family Mg chelatase-like AAA ATPase [Anaerolineales bacterium]|nr:YifB family Mg chelatase-like AAA ATPase [Anaerolineales bacterium]
MLAKVLSCAVIGLDGHVVEVEVDTANGLPNFTIVGLPDIAVQESRERVAAAIRNTGYAMPMRRLTVNLAPAALRKEGPAYDLPIALGVLAAVGVLETEVFERTLIVGELALDGLVRHVRGVLPMTALARAQGFAAVIVPAVDAREAALVPGVDVIGASTLDEIVQHLLGLTRIEPECAALRVQPGPVSVPTDFQDVKGQEHVKRALEVAAAGGHNVLMSGSPGAGKTLLARALPSILPGLSIDEALDVTRVYSVADQLPADTPLIQHRPFRSPHHTISHAGLVGGGNVPRPGEISLAHRGVLFLDELPEFAQRTLEVLRQPLEDRVVTISRAKGTLTFPANFMLVASMNPCPCGYANDPSRECTCSPGVVAKYQKRLSGPLLDRIDIHIDVPRVEYEKLAEVRTAEASAVIRERVEVARERQRRRFVGSACLCNADMRPGDLRQHARLDEAGSAVMKAAMSRLGLSARAFHRVLKLARTIADLAGVDAITAGHLAEALQYRPKVAA